MKVLMKNNHYSTFQIIKDVWDSEEEVSSESESESSSNSDSTSDSESESDSPDVKDMKTEATKDPKVPLKVQTAITTEEAERKPKIPDPTSPTTAIVESVLEHEIPARRTRLARKRHIHMLKSAKKAAAKAAAKQAKAGTSNEAGTGSEVPIKKPRLINQQHLLTTSQPVHLTLGNGPGSLSSSLPMYSILKSSSQAKTSVAPQGTPLRFPVQAQAATQNPSSKPATIVLQQPAGSGGSQPSAAILTKTSTGNSVRYLSLQDLARINPALAQTISNMSIQQQQQQGGTRVNAAKQAPQPVIGAVPGVTCIMKSPPGTTSNTSTSQPGISIPVNQPGSSAVTMPLTNPSLVGNMTVAQSATGIDQQQGVVKTTSATNITGVLNPGQSVIPTLSSSAGTSAAGGKTAVTIHINKPSQLPQSAQLHQPGVSILSNSTSAGTSGYRPATQILSAAPANQPITKPTPRSTGLVTQPVITPSGSSTVPSTVATSLTGGMPTQQLPQANTNVPSQTPKAGAPNPTPTTQAPVAKTTFTITVDANMWKQLQGKPQLQQQVVLNHIRQQQLRLQQQQAALRGKVATSPVKTTLPVNPQNQPVVMPQQQVLPQQQSAQQVQSPVKTVLPTNVQPQQLLQQQLLQLQQQKGQQSKVAVSPVNTVIQPNIQQQMLQQQPKQTQQPHQPARQIIKMSSPQKIPAQQQQPQQQTIPVTTSTLQLTHTQQTQQSNPSTTITQTLHQVPTSPLRITVPIQQKPGAGGSIQLSAAQTASIQQQLLRIQQQQQLQGRNLTLSPSKGIVLQPPGVANPKPNPVSAIQSTTTSNINIQQQPGASLTLSPSKQVVTQPKLAAPGSAKAGMITVPLSALLNQQIKQVQQPGKPPSFVYVLPNSTSVQGASQGSKGLVLQGQPSLAQPASQGSQNVVMVQNSAPNQPVVGQQLQSSRVQNIATTSPQLIQGLQNTTMPNSPMLTQALQGQQALSTQSRNIVQLLQQPRGQPTSNILVSALQNQGTGLSQVRVPVGSNNSAFVVGNQAVSVTQAGGQVQQTLTVPSSAMQTNVQTLTPQGVATVTLAQSSSATSPQLIASQTSQGVVSNLASGLEQPKQGGLSAQQKSAQQTFQ